ncbi:MAG: hypothetical protein ACO1RT_06245 [Planctomycetaceae bacterium]
MLNLSGRGVIAAGVTSIVIAIFPSSLFSAEERERTKTLMAVSEMCGGCVKKKTERFEGIAQFECSIESNR